MKNNRQSNWRYKYAWIDFQFDGMFPNERIKGKDKRILKRKSKRAIIQSDIKAGIYDD